MNMVGSTVRRAVAWRRPWSAAAASIAAGLLMAACAPSAPAAPPATTGAPAAAAPTAVPVGQSSPIGAASPASSPAAAPSAAPAASPVQAAASPAAAAAPRLPGPAQPVRIGLSTAGAINAGVYVADGLGFFTEEGIDLQYVSFGSASDIVPALSRGDLDVADAGINPATFNALGRNIAMKLVADKGSQPLGYPINIFVVAKDMADAIKGPADLKGRKVAVTPPGQGTATGFTLSKYLAQANLTLGDVDIVPLSFPEQVAALTNRSVDAALMAEPFASAVLGSGVGTLLTTTDRIAPDQQFSAIVYTDRFIAGSRDLGVRWMRAYIRGIRAYLAAFGNGTDKDRVIQTLTEKTNITDPRVWAQIFPVGLNPNGELNAQSIADSAAFFQTLGLVQTVPDVNAIIDSSFTAAAIQGLGSASMPAPPSRGS